MEYHKIDTLYERNLDTHKLIEPLVIKNPTYGLIKRWLFTEKIDGMNIRAIWKPAREGVVVPWPESLDFRGKTDKAVIGPEHKCYKSLMKYLTENITADKLRGVFTDSCVVLYGEGYGAGINKGGSYRTDQSFILFDVFVVDHGNPFGGWWLNDEGTRDVAAKLGIDAVPFVCYTELELATEMVRTGFKSKIGVADAEGLVGRPAETLYDKRGRRVITKIKTRDFSGRE